MAGSEQGSSKATIDQVLEQFDGKKDSLTALGEKTKILVEEILKDSKIIFQSIQARVKSREKLRKKYLDPKKEYKELDDITDQVALRIITYYEDEIDRVAETIKSEFEVDPKRSVDKRETDPQKFGYYALNYVCRYSSARVSHVEYKKFAGIWFEVQVASILRHAWSEIEHPWYDLKDDYPADIKRRFARMAALLEIAESEFLSLRKIQSDYQKSIAVRVEAKVPDLPINSVSMKSFVLQDPAVIETDQLIATTTNRKLTSDIPDVTLAVRTKVATLSGFTTLDDVRAALRKYQNPIVEYVRRCKNELWGPTTGSELNPGVSIFHLGTLLASHRGIDTLTAFRKNLGVRGSVDLERQVAIAKETLKKYGN